VSASAKLFQVIDGRTIPDWKTLLSAQENKQALINVFGTYLLQIVRNDQVVQPGHTLYVAGIFGNPEVVHVFLEKHTKDESRKEHFSVLHYLHFPSGPTFLSYISFWENIAHKEQSNMYRMS
jgi:hypothetical protein